MCTESKSSSVENHDEHHRETLKETGFWGTQGAGCLILARATSRFLVPLRSSRVLQPNQWGTLGGAVDPGETPENTVIRELHEEAGHAGEIEEVLALYVFRKVTGPDQEFRYYNFLLIVQDEFEPVVNWETERFEWVDFARLNALTPMHFGLRGLLDNSGNKLAAAAGFTLTK